MSEQEWLDIFGDNLRYILDEYGYTREQFAEATGISQATISRYINKQKIPSLKNIINMSLELGIDMEDFIMFGGDRIY